MRMMRALWNPPQLAKTEKGECARNGIRRLRKKIADAVAADSLLATVPESEYGQLMTSSLHRAG